MEVLEVGTLAAKEAGKVHLKYFKNAKEVREKNKRDLVCKADLESEKAIIDIIKEKFPDHNILSEEIGEINQDSEYTWVIDPLDGTGNFLKGSKDFCVLVSLQNKGETILGITWFPATEDLYIAQKGKGATKNGNKIVVKTESTLPKLYANTHMSSIEELRKSNLQIYSDLLFKVRNIKVFSACIGRALTDVAEGIADFHFRKGFHKWDYTAGALLIEEMGGNVSDFDGNSLSENTKDVVVSNNGKHKEILAMVNES